MSPDTFDIDQSIVTMGSCFADSIGSRLLQFKLQALVNPFGVIYSPPAIHKALRYAIFNEPVPPHTFVQNQDVHLNYDFHSEFSSLRLEDLQNHLKETIGTTHYFLNNARWLVLTYGTAFVYERNDTGEIVANCHKQPTTLFRKSLLTQQQITNSFQSLYRELKQFNPSIRIILTVSPVRHIKDTLELNSVSKSLLRVACHTLTEAFPDVVYFPAYEILLDDLRDYRFYKNDMLHPTTEAEDYIWEHFMATYGSQNLNSFIEKWKSIQQALSHKPFQPASAAHQKFIRDTLHKLDELKSVVDVEKELTILKNQLLS